MGAPLEIVEKAVKVFVVRTWRSLPFCKRFCVCEHYTILYPIFDVLLKQMAIIIKDVTHTISCASFHFWCACIYVLPKVCLLMGTALGTHDCTIISTVLDRKYVY